MKKTIIMINNLSKSTIIPILTNDFKNILVFNLVSWLVT